MIFFAFLTLIQMETDIIKPDAPRRKAKFALSLFLVRQPRLAPHEALWQDLPMERILSFANREKPLETAIKMRRIGGFAVMAISLCLVMTLGGCATFCQKP